MAIPMALRNAGFALAQHLSPDEIAFLRYYSRGGARLINQFLYNQSSYANDRDYMHQMNKRTQIIDSIFEKSELPTDITVYRGLNAKRAGFCGTDYKNPDITNAVGKTYTFNGYVSTSASVLAAKIFMYSAKETQAMLAIHVPAGTPAIPMVPQLSEYPDEDEVLLPRNAQLRIVEVTQEENPLRTLAQTDQIYTIHAEMKTR